MASKLEITLKTEGSGEIMTMGELVKELSKFNEDLIIRLLYKESKSCKQERALITITMEENL